MGIESWDLGGVALNDPSLGLLYQTWHAFCLDGSVGEVYLEADNITPFLWRTFPGISELSLTFDQNMSPFLAFVQNGVARFHWWDTVSAQYVTTDLENGATSPKCSLDDKRKESQKDNISDILLLYLVGGSLYYRQQRDRYDNAYLISTNPDIPHSGLRLGEVGLNIERRFQWRLEAAYFPV